MVVFFLASLVWCAPLNKPNDILRPLFLFHDPDEYFIVIRNNNTLFCHVKKLMGDRSY